MHEVDRRKFSVHYQGRPHLISRYRGAAASLAAVALAPSRLWVSSLER